jgi:hypothetical protein
VAGLAERQRIMEAPPAQGLSDQKVEGFALAAE